jgi:hypothetical protein
MLLREKSSFFTLAFVLLRTTLLETWTYHLPMPTSKRGMPPTHPSGGPLTWVAEITMTSVMMLLWVSPIQGTATVDMFFLLAPSSPRLLLLVVRALLLVVGALLLPEEEASAHLLLVVLLAVLAVVLLVVVVDQGSLLTN